MDIKAGDTITIKTASASAHCAIATTCIVGSVVKTTDKAIRITANAPSKGKDYSAWLPKSALAQKKECASSRRYFEADGTDYDEFLRTSFDLKQWFKNTASGYDAWFISNCVETLISSS